MERLQGYTHFRSFRFPPEAGHGLSTLGPGGGGGGMGHWPISRTPPHPHIRKVCIGRKMKFMKEAGNLQPILGTPPLV